MDESLFQCLGTLIGSPFMVFMLLSFDICDLVYSISTSIGIYIILLYIIHQQSSVYYISIGVIRPSLVVLFRPPLAASATSAKRHP